MTPESSTQSHEVERYSWHAARNVANATRHFVDAADFDALALRHREEVAGLKHERDRAHELRNQLATENKRMFGERQAALTEAEALRARVGEMREALAELLEVQRMSPGPSSIDLFMREQKAVDKSRALLNATKGAT